jgi:hypothetical protein
MASVSNAAVSAVAAETTNNPGKPRRATSSTPEMGPIAMAMLPAAPNRPRNSPRRSGGATSATSAEAAVG